jgi:triacylglycerol lipase
VSQRLDVFRPASAAAPRPARVFVHGGAFRFDDKHAPGSPYYDNVMRWAARRGMVGVNLNYRTGPQNPWPKSTDDIATTLAWLREHAGEFGVDRRRIVLMGHSSGAVLVATALALPAL